MVQEEVTYGESNGYPDDGDDNDLVPDDGGVGNHEDYIDQEGGNSVEKNDVTANDDQKINDDDSKVEQTNKIPEV